MAIDYKPEQNEYKNMTPFKTWLMYQINTWGVNNFPFLENDFDQLTNYGMMMKLMKALNDNITNQNLVEEDMTKLYEAFTELQTYIDNYFDNLDVQDEINNKLDEMAKSGELTDIIAQYLQLAGVLAYDTKTAMKSAENLVNGSIAKTLGNLSYSDGEGAFYKVREIVNTDVVDDNNIVALHNPDLVAEKIHTNYKIKTKINPLIPEFFQNNTTLVLGGTDYKLADPCIVYDSESEQYLMFLWNKLTVSAPTTCCRAISSDLRTFTIVDRNVLADTSIERTKPQILVNEYGEPVKINNKYHMYTIGFTPLAVYHAEATSLAGDWTETGNALVYPNLANNGTDTYGPIAVTPVYDEFNNKIILYTMVAPATSKADYGYGTRINRYVSNVVDNSFVYDGETLTPSGQNDWLKTWIGGFQVIRTTAGLQVVFNAGYNTISDPAGESSPSQIGMGYMDNLYSSVRDITTTPILPINNTLDNNEDTNNWKCYAFFNKVMNCWYMYYNTGKYNDQEVIVCARPSVAVNGTSDLTTVQYLTSSPVIVRKSDRILPNGIFKYHLAGNVMINDANDQHGATSVSLKFWGSNTDVGTIDPNATLLRQVDTFLGQYAWDNRNEVIEGIIENNGNYKRIYATAQVTNGGTSNTCLRGAYNYLQLIG